MTAAVLYGKEQLRIERVDIPSLAPGDVLVHVRTALTCGTDVKVFRRGYHALMIQPPSLFGHELAGDIVAVGDEVSRFSVGQRVVAANSAPCEECFFCQRGLQNLCEDLLFNNGAYAEYIRIPGRIVQQNMLEIPDGVTYADAAMTEPLACVLRGIHETGIKKGDTAVVIGCGAIGLKFIRILAQRQVRVIAIGKGQSQMDIAKRLGATAAFDVAATENPVAAVRQLTEGARGADAVIEAVGRAQTWEWALQIVRKGGTVNLFGGCPSGTEVKIDPAALHYAEITIKSTFHHTPQFIREALETIARGEIRASDFVTGEVNLDELPKLFQDMKNRNGELKTAVIP
jgi:L-iditol 2-dehydrogenase